MFTQPAGDRPGVPNFAVLITDGASDNSLRTISEAFLAKRSGIHFVVVGVGVHINIGELYTLASYPYSVNYLPASDVDALNNLIRATLDIVCNSKFPLQASLLSSNKKWVGTGGSLGAYSFLLCHHRTSRDSISTNETVAFLTMR